MAKAQEEIVLLKVHLNSGETLKFDLNAEEDAKKWLYHVGDPALQASITAATIEHNGASFSVLRPAGCSTLSFYADVALPNGRNKGGEQIVLTADDIKLTVKAHHGQAATRVCVKRLYRVQTA